MPKKVDHDERRREIVGAVWRVLADRGLSALSMRAIADEAGYANGVLAYYFANKNEVLQVAYEHVYHATNERVDAAAGDARGVDALRILCREILPLTEESLLEARIATSLWQRAMYDPVIGRINIDAWADWRIRITDCLQQALDDGHIRETDVVVAADRVLSMLMGVQVMAVLDPEAMTSSHQMGMLEDSIGDLLPK
ncbi:TetR/AcrR family transcriptional regulator [Rhodococcus sp. IEGM 1381]|uniref:TetR/AcrR family transcriptional regulator n=1 Tax=Rhodococcus sp. IEGM 1381 TaxID=3047085 RepID=UPI0024B6C4ED|nr:TetR/AcrR family transcriptional regulator [Rhodococcus sp. IEGM 1381]MDI9893292.1 TetR/AcrR family transcriptional regulator [Rhodococcus sp. IEGM 1381]